MDKIIKDVAKLHKWDTSFSWALHGMRHGSAEYAKREYGRDDAAQQFLGHSSKQTTNTFYAKNLVQRQQQSTKKNAKMAKAGNVGKKTNVKK